MADDYEFFTGRSTTVDVLDDKTQFAFYVIDNSASMSNVDGKSILKTEDGRVHIFGNGKISRWDEAKEKILQIAKVLR